MEKLVTCAKILTDKEYLANKKQLNTLKKTIGYPRIPYKNRGEWTNDRNHAIDNLIAQVTEHVKINQSINIDSLFEYKNEPFIRNKVYECLYTVSKNKEWSNKKAIIIDEYIKISFNTASRLIDYNYSHRYCTFIQELIIQYLYNDKLGCNLNKIPLFICSRCESSMDYLEPYLDFVQEHVCETCTTELFEQANNYKYHI